MCCVMESASYNLKRLTLELGGNDAAIVMSDVNIDEVAPLIFWGAFANSSQYCFPITLVDNPPEDSRIVREEPFGPILPCSNLTTLLMLCALPTTVNTVWVDRSG